MRNKYVGENENVLLCEVELMSEVGLKLQRNLMKIQIYLKQFMNLHLRGALAKSTQCILLSYLYLNPGSRLTTWKMAKSQDLKSKPIKVWANQVVNLKKTTLGYKAHLRGVI